MHQPPADGASAKSPGTSSEPVLSAFPSDQPIPPDATPQTEPAQPEYDQKSLETTNQQTKNPESKAVARPTQSCPPNIHNDPISTPSTSDNVDSDGLSIYHQKLPTISLKDNEVWEDACRAYSYAGPEEVLIPGEWSFSNIIPAYLNLV